MDCIHNVPLSDECLSCEVGSVETLDDYFVPDTCPDCYGTLDSDGLHWASQSDTCPARENVLRDSTREFYRNQQLEQVED